MRYKSPQALEQAVRAAARESEMDTNRAISGFYFHRFLCRVFSDPGCPFVLKGGQGMLARTVDARRTRDIDLSTSELGMDDAVAELKRLASAELGDYVSFRYLDCAKIKDGDEYREGLRVRFTPLMGAKAMDPPIDRSGRRRDLLRQSGRDHACRQVEDRWACRVRLPRLPCDRRHRRQDMFHYGNAR